jgi:peptide/nickel transport system substrate-binding protein
MSYSNPELDEIAQRAATLQDKEERKRLYHRIQDIIVTDLPYINLFNEQKTTVIRAGWSGFNTEPETFDKALTWFGYYTVTPPGR